MLPGEIKTKCKLEGKKETGQCFFLHKNKSTCKLKTNLGLFIIIILLLLLESAIQGY